MLETLLVLAVGAVAALPIAAALMGRTVASNTHTPTVVAFWIAVGLVVLAVPFFGFPTARKAEAQANNRPLEHHADGYVGSDACRSCHRHQHETWHDSYHRTMTQAASDASIIGDFNNVQLRGVDLDTRLFKKDGKHFAELLQRNPTSSGTYEVVMTTGSHHRQAYWLGSKGDPRLMMLPYMYVKAEGRWIPRHSGYVNSMCLQARPEIGVLERDFNRWQAVCINCHATHGTPRPENDEAKARRGTAAEVQVAELGISCEACHGPGGEHVRANSSPARRYALHLNGEPDPTIVNPARLPHDRASEICGQCHGVSINRDDAAQRRWVHHGHTYRPGDTLGNDPIKAFIRGPREKNAPERLDDWKASMEDGSFWADGMYRASGREFNGLVESPCFERGTMSCMSCHRMHQAKDDARPRLDWADDQLGFEMDGNKACLQCHEKFGSADALAKHTHHAAGSSGSLCYNCHMPLTTYGITKAIRSHQISSPSVKASLDTGRPNACNQCHLDKTLQWVADSLKSRYGIASPPLAEDDKRVAASVNWILKGDAGQRAILAWSYGWDDARAASGPHWQAPFLAQLLDDRYDAVRLVAWRSLKKSEGFRDFAYDFVGSQEHRRESARRARQLWEGLPKSGVKFPRGALMDERGTLIESEFRRLWERRDDRPMSINE